MPSPPLDPNPMLFGFKIPLAAELEHVPIVLGDEDQLTGRGLALFEGLSAFFESDLKDGRISAKLTVSFDHILNRIPTVVLADGIALANKQRALLG